MWYICTKVAGLLSNLNSWAALFHLGQG